LGNKLLKGLLVFAMFLSVILPITSVNAEEIDVISIKLQNYIGNKTELSITYQGEYENNKGIVDLKENTNYKIKVEAGNLKVLEGSKVLKDLGTSTIMFSPKTYSTNSYIEINGRKYLGSMEFAIESGKYVRPTNKDVPFEDYLKGVVPYEMPASWNLEALKAQTIAARTYAARHVGSTVLDTQAYQVYGGYIWNNSLYTKSNQAVSSTKGEVLKYNNSLISAVYSSSNGGVTESNSNEWGSTQVPYLPVKTDNYDPENPWSLKVQTTQINMSGKNLSKPLDWWSSSSEEDYIVTSNIKNWLQKNGYANTDIKIISISNLAISPDKTSSGRSKESSINVEFYVRDKSTNTFRMQDGKIKKHIYNGTVNISNLRAMLGASLIKSSLIDKTTSYGSERLSGKTRFEVAVNISKENWSSADTVFISFYNAFADALAAAPLAYKYDAPILLTHSDKLTDATKNEIIRLKAKNVVITGGSASVSENVVRTLKNIGISVTRIGGKDRFEVANSISKKLGSPNKAIVANGLNFPDALAIAPYAAKNNIPIFLTRSNNIPDTTYQTIKNLNPSEIIVVGGSASVNSTVYNKLPSSKKKRIDGKDRFEVAGNVFNQLPLSKSQAYLANGLTFADALTGSVAAAKNNTSILLTWPTYLPSNTINLIDNNNITNFTILGGSASVSTGIANSLPKEAFSIHGRGYGHGVGMSQYGAQSMASKGIGYREILSFYYPGTNLTNY
jgi:stage II sporulation protein D